MASRRNWFKLYSSDILHKGDAISDLSAEEFGIYSRLLCLASDNAIQGEISISKNVPYTIDQLSSVTKSYNSKLQSTLQKLECNETIKIKKGVIYIVNWDKYQSEYNRQKPYRNKAKKRKVTTQSYNSKLQQKLSGEVEVEVDINNRDTKKTVSNNFNPYKYFLDKYKEYRNTEYIPGNRLKEAGQLKTVLNKVGKDDFIRAVDNYHESRDKFIVDNAYSVSIFIVKINVLLAQNKSDGWVTNI